MPSIAAKTRQAVDRRPYLRQALRAGVLNYTEAARKLGVAEETDAVASALRRYAEELPPLDHESGTVRVRMDRSIEETPLVVGELRNSGPDVTAITLSGDLDPGTFGRVLSLLTSSSIAVEGAGIVDGTGIILVPDQSGSDAVRVVDAIVTER